MRLPVFFFLIIVRKITWKMILSLSPTQNGEHITLFPRAPRPDSLWCDHVGRGSQQDKVGRWQVKGSSGLKAASCPQTALRPTAELLFQSCQWSVPHGTQAGRRIWSWHHGVGSEPCWAALDRAPHLPKPPFPQWIQRTHGPLMKTPEVTE